MIIKEYFSFEMQVFMAMLSAFLISFFLIPRVIVMAREKHILDEPGSRSSHYQAVPTLGGIGIYYGFLIPVLIFAGLNESKLLPFLTAACIVIFLIGIKDDLTNISPRTKLIGQLIAALVMIVFADIRITDLHGIMGINEIPYIISVLFTLFIYIALTNAYNLMDGIDGLAASLGIVGSLGFGVYFIYVHKINASVSCFSLIGSLSAFLIYNYAKGNKKIFMGDTGSLIIGFILTTYAIVFNEITTVPVGIIKVQSAPVVSIAILAIPIFDTIRVFVTRILKGKSPFSADKTHIHHELLANGYSHHQATALIASFSLLLILLIYALQDHVGLYQLFMILILSVLLFYIVPFTYIFRQINLRFLRLFSKSKSKIK